MKATFKVIKLKRYEGVGNQVEMSQEEYVAKRTAAELEFYGEAGGTYYLPVFEITFDNGVVAEYENYYERELVEEISADELTFKMADGDTLGFFKPELVELDSDNAVTSELKTECLNRDFSKNMEQAVAGDMYWAFNLGDQAVWAAGLRDCEVYVLNSKEA